MKTNRTRQPFQVKLDNIGARYLNSLQLYLEAKEQMAVANFENLIYSAVGIGEHVKLNEDMISLLEEIASARDSLETLADIREEIEEASGRDEDPDDDYGFGHN
jgi:hypothetical protein